MRIQAYHYWKTDLKELSGFEQDSNPQPLRYRCNALPTELSKPHERGRLHDKYLYIAFPHPCKVT